LTEICVDETGRYLELQSAPCIVLLLSVVAVVVIYWCGVNVAVLERLHFKSVVHVCTVAQRN